MKFKWGGIYEKEVCLTNLSGDNIDDGVPLDYEIDLVDGDSIDCTRFYSFSIYKNYFDSLSE